MTPALRIGVSSCLLGQEVRWDGGHKLAPFLIEGLGRTVEWVPVCPEVEVGMGIPRPTLRLARRGGQLRLLESGSDRDHTRAMRAYAPGRIAQLTALELCGFVLKSGSPSCGLAGVEVHGGQDGRGLFADQLLRAAPELPVEEEGRLVDRVVRERFLERAFAYRRLRAGSAGRV